MKIYSARFLFKIIALFAVYGVVALSAKAADTKSATVGKSVTISVTAAGTQPFTYQWYKDGTAISSATSASYVISSAAYTDAAKYTASVTNSAGTTTSDTAVLTVLPTAPTITQQPTAQTATIGKSATFSVTATGSDTLTYQWTKAGVSISGATSSSYTISSVTSSDAGSYAVVVTNNYGSLSSSAVTSSSVTLTVYAATTITSQPTSQTVTAGQSATFSVTATGSGTLTYQWTKAGTNISGATSSSYTITSTTSNDAGSYAVVVTGSGGSVTSSTATLTVNPASGITAPDGYASLVTGGAAGTAVTVSNAADLRTYAESSTAYVITVSGTITLSSSISVKSNKTIQGANSSATIVGLLDLSSGSVSNVIIRGLNITNASGNGITLRNASYVFITHCSIYDCTGNLIEISNSSDYVTVSWSEFYYNSSSITNRKTVYVGLAGSETKALHVTLHHNWWSDLCDQSMPSGTYGYVHLYNNYFGAVSSTSALSNTSGTVASDNAQFLVERNNYNQVKAPLYKENLDTTKTAGLIRGINNTFTSCTGTSVDAGTDSIFTPSYSYEMYHQDDVDAVLPSLVGNTGGATSATPTTSTATVTGPSSAVSPGSSFTLTAVPSGFTGVSYQWRKNNVDISGATSSTYSVASMQSANAATYTVMIGISSGNYVVSAPLSVTLNSSTSNDTGSSSSSSGSSAAAASSGGGGGAPSTIYLAVLIVLGLVRLATRRRQTA